MVTKQITFLDRGMHTLPVSSYYVSPVTGPGHLFPLYNIHGQRIWSEETLCWPREQHKGIQLQRCMKASKAAEEDSSSRKLFGGGVGFLILLTIIISPAFKNTLLVDL